MDPGEVMNETYADLLTRGKQITCRAMTVESGVLIAFNLIFMARGRYLGHVDAGYSPRPGWVYRTN